MHVIYIYIYIHVNLKTNIFLLAQKKLPKWLRNICKIKCVFPLIHIVHLHNALKDDIQIAATNMISSTAGLSLKYKSQVIRTTNEQPRHCMLQR